MDCKDFREVLDLYVDRELSAEAAMAAGLHLEDCARCRKAESELRKMRNALKQVAAKHEPPPELVREIERVTQSRWRFLKNVSPARWLGRDRITLPAPVFALLMFAFVAVTLLAIRPLWINHPKSPAVAKQTPGDKPTGIRADSIDLSRFDHGGRVRLTKEAR